MRRPGGRPLGPARLRRWQFFIARSGYASLRRKSMAVTHGIVWRLSRPDLKALDLYEDVAGGLYRKTRLVLVLEGRKLPALVYLALDAWTGHALSGYQEAIVAAADGWHVPRHARRTLEAWLPSAAV